MKKVTVIKLWSVYFTVKPTWYRKANQNHTSYQHILTKWTPNTPNQWVFFYCSGFKHQFPNYFSLSQAILFREKRLSLETPNQAHLFNPFLIVRPISSTWQVSVFEIFMFSSILYMITHTWSKHVMWSFRLFIPPFLKCNSLSWRLSFFKQAQSLIICVRLKHL